jgi:hypothetical protein
MLKYLEIVENLPKKTECHTAIILDKRALKMFLRRKNVMESVIENPTSEEHEMLYSDSCWNATS